MRWASRATSPTGSASCTRAGSSRRARRSRSSPRRERRGRSSSCSGSSTPAACEYRSILMLEREKHIDISLEPLDEYLVIQPSNDETETRAGLILPASAAASVAVRTGIVTAVGADVTGIDVGEKVLYPREAGFEVRLGGIEVRVLKREELIARVHD